MKIARIVLVAHAQSQLIWNVSQKLSKDCTMWFLQNGTDYYANIMLIRQVTEC